MSVFEQKKRHLREGLLYFFSVKKFAFESHRLLVKAYDEVALNEISAVTGFDATKMVILMWKTKNGPKLVEDAELEVLLNEDPYQTQKEFAESLRVAQSTISTRSKALRMIQNQGNWVPYELKPRDLKKRFSRVNNCYNGKNGKVFCIV